MSEDPREPIPSPEPQPVPAPRPRSRGTGRRPGAPTVRERRERKIATALERFADAIPDLLIEITGLIRNSATTPGVRVQLIQNLDKVLAYLPPRPPAPPPEENATLLELVAELKRRGHDGKVSPIDVESPTALAEQRDQLAGEILELERRLAGLRGEVFEAIEARPLTPPPVEPEREDAADASAPQSPDLEFWKPPTDPLPRVTGRTQKEIDGDAHGGPDRWGQPKMF